MKRLIEIPYILGANTYYWSPGGSASQRRANEDKRQREVYDFFDSLGMNVDWSMNTVSAVGEGLEIEFYYKESCSNVYKQLKVEKNGRRSNITSIRKLVNVRNARIEKIEVVLQAA